MSEAEIKDRSTTRLLPSYEAIIARLRDVVTKRSDAAIETIGTLNYQTADGTKTYESVKIASKNIARGDRILLIRAGIHGDEVAGPLTMYAHLDEIISHAHCLGIKLIIFPLDNPSGYEYRMRYNVEDDRGSHDEGNNDFVRYEFADGSMRGDLIGRTDYMRWYWASDPYLQKKIGLRLPAETTLLHQEIKRLPLSQIAAIIDLHQDNFLQKPGAYFYAYYPDGNTTAYDAILAKVGALTPLLRHEKIGSGQRSPMLSDERGGIECHDGSLPDLFFHLQTPHCITVETTGITQPKLADEVNTIWIEGVLELVAAES